MELDINVVSEVSEVNEVNEVNEVKSSSDMDDKSLNTCVICIDNISLTTEDIIKLECDHFYHKECIHKWLNSNNNCPICRKVTNYKVNDIENEIDNENQNTNITINRQINNLHYNKYLVMFSITIYVVTVLLNAINLITLPSMFNFINYNYFENISNNTINSTDCIDNDNPPFYDIINFNDVYILLIFYLLYTFMLPLFLNISKTYVFLIVHYIPFFIWYGYIIQMYFSVFQYLNIMKKGIYCEEISDKIRKNIHICTIMFGLITTTYLVFNILVTYYYCSLKMNRNMIRPQV